MDSLTVTGTLILIVIVFVSAVIALVIVEKIFSKKRPKRVIDTGCQTRRIDTGCQTRRIDTGCQTRRIDPDKVAQALGAEYVGKIGHKAGGGYFGALQTAADKPVPPTIIEATEDFQIKLEDALKVAGLPTDTRNVIGQMFHFQATLPRSVHQHTIIGTIMGLEISNLNKGVNLFLSARQFNGLKIERLHVEYVDFLNERHYILILKDGSAIPGQFRLM